jgi:hypothetical protein
MKQLETLTETLQVYSQIQRFTSRVFAVLPDVKWCPNNEPLNVFFGLTNQDLWLKLSADSEVREETTI